MATIKCPLLASHVAAASDRLVRKLLSRTFRGVFQIHLIRLISPFVVIQNAPKSSRKLWYRTVVAGHPTQHVVYTKLTFIGKFIFGLQALI